MLHIFHVCLKTIAVERQAGKQMRRGLCHQAWTEQGCYIFWSLPNLGTIPSILFGGTERKPQSPQDNWCPGQNSMWGPTKGKSKSINLYANLFSFNFS
jgi:hypothetical protein